MPTDWENLSQTLEHIGEKMKNIGDMKIPEFPSLCAPEIELPEFIAIDPEKTIMGDIKHKIQEQNRLVSQQLAILNEQNQMLSNNYDKLKEMYDAQVQAAREAREDLHRSRVFNGWMMVIAAVSMLAAVASPIITIWLELLNGVSK